MWEQTKQHAAILQPILKTCGEFSIDLCMAETSGFHISQWGFELVAALLVSQDLCLCSARRLDHQIISGRPPANEQQSHMTCDSHRILICCEGSSEML